MRIAIASGKGGTGKTTVATNLALTATLYGKSVQLIDCDVEEPNCHIFVKPEITLSEPVNVPVPVVSERSCSGCGECAASCEFNALACVGGKVMVFPELCHSCGGCCLACPEGAIRPGRRRIGTLEEGEASGFRFTQGRLKVGEAIVPPMIKAVKARAAAADIVIYDSPPGTSCSAITAMKGSDYVVLVTEPTPFGQHDLEIAVETVRCLGHPMGVVINRAGCGDDRIHRFCERQHLAVLVEIPDDRRIAEAYSEGRMVIDAVPETIDLFDRLFQDIHLTRIGGAACASS